MKICDLQELGRIDLKLIRSIRAGREVAALWDVSVSFARGVPDELPGPLRNRFSSRMDLQILESKHAARSVPTHGALPLGQPVGADSRLRKKQRASHLSHKMFRASCPVTHSGSNNSVTWPPLPQNRLGAELTWLVHR